MISVAESDDIDFLDDYLVHSSWESLSTLIRWCLGFTSLKLLFHVCSGQDYIIIKIWKRLIKMLSVDTYLIFIWMFAC